MHYLSDPDKAADLVLQLLELPGVKAAAFQADLSDYDNVRMLHQDVVAFLGHPDILFNNAGTTGKMIGPQGDIQTVSIEEFESTWKLNTGSSYLVCTLSSELVELPRSPLIYS